MTTNQAHAATSIPADFDAYWDALDAELARYPAAPELEPLPLRSSTDYTCYALRLTSVGPYRIFGYYSVPTEPARSPACSITPRYGSVNHAPALRSTAQRYAVLADHAPRPAAGRPALRGGLSRPVDPRHRRPGHATSTAASSPTACAAPSSCASRPEVDTLAYRHRRRRPGADDGRPPPDLQGSPGQPGPALPAGRGPSPHRRLPDRRGERLSPRPPRACRGRRADAGLLLRARSRTARHGEDSACRGRRRHDRRAGVAGAAGDRARRFRSTSTC